MKKKRNPLYDRAKGIVYLGYTLKNQILGIIKHRCFQYLFVPLFVLFLILVLFNKAVNIAVPVYNNFLLYITTALIGITLVLYLSQFKLFAICDFFGKNSLVVFCMHGIWLFIYESILSYIYKYDYHIMQNIPDSLCIIGSILILLVSIPTVRLVTPMYEIFYSWVSSKLLQ